jgi:hypothetical protein
VKRRVALTLTFIAGTLPILAFFTNIRIGAVDVDVMSGRLETWMVIVAGCALTLGVVNVVQSHLRKIARREAGWIYSVALLVSLAFMGGAGILGAFGMPVAGINKNPDGSSTPFDWIFGNVFFPLQATMFALLAFFMASAAYRAFRIRSFQATLLLIAAVVVMLGRIPFGELISPLLPESWVGTAGGERLLPWLTNWIMDTPNSAAQSGIIIGAALGAAAMSLRVILGLETSYLGKGKEG